MPDEKEDAAVREAVVSAEWHYEHHGLEQRHYAARHAFRFRDAEVAAKDAEIAKLRGLLGEARAVMLPIEELGEVEHGRLVKVIIGIDTALGREG